jgi:N-acetyl sugar amidotransferase
MMTKVGTGKINTEKINVIEKYKLSEKVEYCNKCVISNQRPRIVFDENGVCNACLYWDRKGQIIDWSAREKELKDLCDRFRRKDGRHDVVVPSSGGKDSAFVAHQLKYKYKMNPLTITWAPHIYTDIGWSNFQALIHAGLDNVLGTPNGLVHRKMTRLCTIEMGEPFQPFIYGQSWYALQIAVGYDIPLVFDGENGEAEYGGDPSSENKVGFSFEDASSYWHSGKDLSYWLDHGFTQSDLNFYMPPPIERILETKVERHFFSYYKNWRPQEHYYYAAENTGFQANPEGRSEGTYSKYASLDDKTDPFHFYFMLLKFGIGRATSDAAHEIREGVIQREEAVQLVRRYDTEFPKKSLKVFLDYCEFTEEEFWAICERWRNLNLWKKEEGEWVLKFQV